MTLYDPANETKIVLQKILEISEKNHTILKKIDRRDTWARVFKILYWLFIVSIAFGSYYFLQPYLDVFKNSLDGLSQNMNTEGKPNLEELLKNLGQ